MKCTVAIIASLAFAAVQALPTPVSQQGLENAVDELLRHLGIAKDKRADPLTIVVDDVVDTAGATHVGRRTIPPDVGNLITGFGDLLDDAEDAVNDDLSKLGDFAIA